MYLNESVIMVYMYRILFSFLLFYSSFICERLQAEERRYDPLRLEENIKYKIVDFSINDAVRKRDVPLRIYLPEKRAKTPVILFSHGLGGSRETNAFLGQHWVQRGFVCIFLQHLGSDEDIWRGKNMMQAVKDMHKAANAENLFLRIHDVKFVLDQLEKWNEEEGHLLNGRMLVEQIGMSGHSFGALTTQAVSGQELGVASTFDKRIKASVILSPSAARHISPEKSFGKVALPWLLMTGTKDDSPIGKTDVKSRLAVYPSLPKGDKYEVVLYKAEHSIFNDKGSFRDKEKRNPNHKKVILALSTAFWDYYLSNDLDAKEWLQGDAANSVMEKNDRWQRK